MTSSDSKRAVLDALSERFDTGVAEYVVPALTDSEIAEVGRDFLPSWRASTRIHDHANSSVGS